jgi:hypothetical protein
MSTVMQNEKIEDDFTQVKCLTKAIRLIADSQEGDKRVHAPLIAKMQDNTDAIATKLPKTAKLLTAPPSKRSKGKPKLAVVS